MILKAKSRRHPREQGLTAPVINHAATIARDVILAYAAPLDSRDDYAVLERLANEVARTIVHECCRFANHHRRELG